LQRNSAVPLCNSKDGLHLSPAGGGETPEGVSGVDSWVYILGAAMLRCALSYFSWNQLSHFLRLVSAFRVWCLWFGHDMRTIT